MRHRRPVPALFLLCAALGAGCSGDTHAAPRATSRDDASVGARHPGDAGTKVDAGRKGDAGVASAESPLLPARIRRLSNAEYNGSVAALLATDLTPARGFAPDARQAGFTVNEAQRVDSVLAKQLFVAAEQLARDARGRLPQLAPCASPDEPEACARSFIESFGARVYRRPLDAEEAEGLVVLYREGALDASYEDGIELVIRALLQSGGFLYLTELGSIQASPESAIALTEYELASSLSYLMTGGPPDEQLLAAAARGDLSAPDTRLAEVQRLRKEHPESRTQLVRTLREWLELDRIAVTAKDIAFYPTYEQLGPEFLAESHDFLGTVLDDRLDPGVTASDLATLFGADWTVGSTTLSDFYGAEPRDDGRLQLSARRGVLNQGAFLAVHAHAYESAPILRGAVIQRRVACIPVPDPATLGIAVTAPAADRTLTSRQRFAAHDADPGCAGCHKTIDSFGFAFEHYDGMGAFRDMENDMTVDATTVIDLNKDFDGPYADSNALAEALANSPDVEECFARHLFRAASARSADSRGKSRSSESEDAFIEAWQRLPDVARGNMVDTLSAFVASRLFTHRKAQ